MNTIVTILNRIDLNNNLCVKWLTVPVKSLGKVLFLMFLLVSYAHQDCIYLIKNTEKNSNIIMMVFYFNIFQNIVK